MEILVGSVGFIIVFGIILPIIYFFRSKASVAFGWLFLGWIVGGIGGCVGMGKLAKGAIEVTGQAIEDAKKDLDRMGEEWKKDWDKELNKFKKQLNSKE